MTPANIASIVFTTPPPKKMQRHSKHEALQLRGGTATATSATGTAPATTQPAAKKKHAYITPRELTQIMVADLAPHGIRVNAVSPALIGPGFMWDRQNELHAASGSPYFSPDPDAVARAKLGSVPMRRLGSVREVLDTVAFLLSDESSYTTGCNHVVAGGLAVN